MNTKLLRELLEAATPGPWVPVEDFDYYQGGTYYGYGPQRYVHGSLGEYKSCALEDATDLKHKVFRLEGSRADADLIVTLRNALPALLDRLDKLEAVAEAAEQLGCIDARLSLALDALAALNDEGDEG